MEGFTFVATSNPNGQLPTGYCICDHCGARVETGIINIATHWSQCFGKSEFDFMMSDPKRYIEIKRLETIKTDKNEQTNRL